jgi:SAM-dependent methyltransferase
MDLATFHRLQSPAGAALLDRVAAAGPLDDAATLALGTELRRTVDPDLAAAAITTVRLRQRAVAKFGPAAAGMWFTPDGLEQATHPTVAAHRAARLARALGPGASVLDLCCGIGSDLLAAAAAGLRATGVELDPVVAAAARLNTADWATVENGDATTRALDAAAVFVDPARRGARGRVFDPAAYVPPWSFVTGLLTAGRPAAAKVAPGIGHSAVPADVEIEWVSLPDGVKEAALYAGALSTGVRRRASLLPGGHTLAAAGPDTADEPPPVGAVGRWLHEPDGAVIRAHLVGALAAEVDGRLVDPRIAYLTTDAAVATPFARSYEVLDVLPTKTARLRAALRERGVGTLTIKKRGLAIVPDQLRGELLAGATGDAAATIVLTRVAGKATTLLVRPV